MDDIFIIGKDGKLMPMSDSISFDIGEDDSKSMASAYNIETGKYEFSFEVVDGVKQTEILMMLMGLRKEWERMRDTTERLANRMRDFDVLMCRLVDQFKGMKRRKTTYRTIRRDCAKRNRRK